MRPLSTKGNKKRDTLVDKLGNKGDKATGQNKKNAIQQKQLEETQTMRDKGEDGRTIRLRETSRKTFNMGQLETRKTRPREGGHTTNGDKRGDKLRQGKRQERQDLRKAK